MDSRRYRNLLSPIRDSERGASAILAAFGMLLLLGVAAIAVDLGAGWNTRRQGQTTADLAALSGGLSFGSQTAMVDQALAVARANLDTQYGDDEWRAIWQSCTDPGRTPGFLPLPEPAAWGSGTLDCISLSPSFFRVRVPEQETSTSFGGLLGVDTLTTDAYAVVTAWPPKGAGALPFAIEAGAPAGETCLDTSSSPLPPCDRPDRGSFGNITPPQFGNAFLNTSVECDDQAAGVNIAASVAMGVDHILWTYPSSSWTATGWASSDPTANSSVLLSSVNMDLCNEVTDSDGILHAVPADGVLIDGVVVDTGNSTKAPITEGLLSTSNFSDGDPGRLFRSANTLPVRSGSNTYDLDNTPLWDHLFSGGDADEDGNTVAYDDFYAPASCDKANFTSSMTIDDLNLQMQTCIEEYETGFFGGQIFKDSIHADGNPRFGVAPQLWHDNLGSGLTYRPIERFRQVYIAGAWFDLQAVSDHGVFYPGDPNITEWCHVRASGCATIREVEQLTVWLLDSNMISSDAKDLYPGEIDSVELSIFE